MHEAVGALDDDATPVGGEENTTPLRALELAPIRRAPGALPAPAFLGIIRGMQLGSIDR